MATDDPGRGHEADGVPRREGFLASDNVWILIPLAGISIPILAITSQSPLVWVIGAAVLIAAVTAAAHHLLGYRHELRLREIAAQERLALAERERFAAVDRVLEREGVPLPRLDDPPRTAEPPPPPAEARTARRDELSPPR